MDSGYDGGTCIGGETANERRSLAIGDFIFSVGSPEAYRLAPYFLAFSRRSSASLSDFSQRCPPAPL